MVLLCWFLQKWFWVTIVLFLMSSMLSHDSGGKIDTTNELATTFMEMYMM